MKIGKQLQKQRKLHSMSQDELAVKLHISRQSVSKWENGVTLPSFSNVVAISELFELSLDELIKGDAELMEHFEDNGKVQFSKTETIVITSIVVAIVVFVIAKLFGLSVESIDAWLFLPLVISFLGTLNNINWREFNKSLNKKTVVWGIIWLTLLILMQLNGLFPSIFEGFKDFSNPYK